MQNWLAIEMLHTQKDEEESKDKKYMLPCGTYGTSSCYWNETSNIFTFIKYRSENEKHIVMRTRKIWIIKKRLLATFLRLLNPTGMPHDRRQSLRALHDTFRLLLSRHGTFQSLIHLTQNTSPRHPDFSLSFRSRFFAELVHLSQKNWTAGNGERDSSQRCFSAIKEEFLIALSIRRDFFHSISFHTLIDSSGDQVFFTFGFNSLD